MQGFTLNLGNEISSVLSALHIEFLDVAVFVAKDTEIAALRNCHSCYLMLLTMCGFDGNLGKGVVS